MFKPFLVALLTVLPAAPALASDCESVRFETSDGVSLAADWCPAAKGAPVVVLMHMIPPHHDRSNYPAEVRAAWVEAGLSVLNVDRRGAGDSQGQAEQAYSGSTAKLDVAAAVVFAGSRGADTTTWACVGASNGTTACLDYTVHASATEGLAVPKALVYLTGGTYTESQNTVSGSEASRVPSLFTFNVKEEAWSVAQRGRVSAGTWRAYVPGGHGTRLFNANPVSVGDIAVFLKKHLK